MDSQVERRASAGMAWHERFLPARLRSITSVEVAVTGIVAAFLTVFYGLNLFGDFLNVWTHAVAVLRFIGSIFVVITVAVKLDKFPMWLAFIGALSELAAIVYFVAFTLNHEQIVFRLQEFPLVALYLAWLFPSVVSRATIYPVMVFTLGYWMFFGPAVGTEHQSGILNIVSSVFFIVVGMFVGTFVKRKFKQQTELDPLTGAVNRRGLGARGDALLLAGKKHSSPVSVVMIDMDKFKQINDELGHEAGDEALCELVQHLHSNTRKRDVVARLGGDEFVLLLPNTNLVAAQALMLRVHGSSRLKWSFGVAEAAADDNLSMVILRADRAMYAFKRARSELRD